MKLKPFLTISEVKGHSYVVGLTDRYKAEIGTVSNTSIDEGGVIDVKRLQQLGLADNIEKIEEVDSRTASFLSIFDDSPGGLLKKIRCKKVLVVGCGGLGSRVLLELVSLGLNDITVCDPDTVSISNLPRMFYLNRNDLDSPKVDALSKLAESINPQTNVITHFGCSEEFLINEDLEKYDFIFITADGDDGAFLEKVGAKLGSSSTPHMPLGYWESTLIAGPIVDINSEKKLSHLYGSSQAKKRSRVQRDFIPPSIGFSNSIISGVGLTEFIKYFSPSGSDLNNRQWQMDVFNLKASLTPVI